MLEADIMEGQVVSFEGSRHGPVYGDAQVITWKITLR